MLCAHGKANPKFQETSSKHTEKFQAPKTKTQPPGACRPLLLCWNLRFAICLELVICLLGFAAKRLDNVRSAKNDESQNANCPNTRPSRHLWQYALGRKWQQLATAGSGGHRPAQPSTRWHRTAGAGGCGRKFRSQLERERPGECLTGACCVVAVKSASAGSADGGAAITCRWLPRPARLSAAGPAGQSISPRGD